MVEPNGPYNPRAVIPIIEKDLITKINNNDKNDITPYENIIIKYFNNEDLYIEDLNCLDCIDYESNRNMFYMLLLTIFCIDFYTKKLLS